VLFPLRSVIAWLRRSRSAVSRATICSVLIQQSIEEMVYGPSIGRLLKTVPRGPRHSDRRFIINAWSFMPGTLWTRVSSQKRIQSPKCHRVAESSE